MQASRKVATWLELAVAPRWRLQSSTIKVHALAGRANRCFALSMKGRWLCAGDGSVTVFSGLGAALHFLELLKVAGFEPGEPDAAGMPHDLGWYCLRLDPGVGLQACTGCAGKAPGGPGPIG